MNETKNKIVDIHVNLPANLYNSLCEVVKKKEGKISRKINKHAVKAIQEYIERNDV